MSSCRIRVASTVVAVDMLAAATARTNSWSSLFVGCTHRQPENRVVKRIRFVAHNRDVYVRFSSSGEICK